MKDILLYLFGATGMAKAIGTGCIPIAGDVPIAILAIVLWPFTLILIASGWVLLQLVQLFNFLWGFIL